MSGPQEPKLDPANNRTIRFTPAQLSGFQKLRRAVRAVRPRRSDLGSYLVSFALVAVGFVVGRCAS